MGNKARVLYRCTSAINAKIPFSAGFETDETGIIVESAPILKRFRGAHLDELRSQARRHNWIVEQTGEQRRGAVRRSTKKTR